MELKLYTFLSFSKNSNSLIETTVHLGKNGVLLQVNGQLRYVSGQKPKLNG